MNKTLDHMEAGRADGTVSLEQYNAILDVCDAVPALDDKMTIAYKGMTDRLVREAEKAARAAERQAEFEARRAAHNRQRAYGQSAKRSSQGRNEKNLEEINGTDNGEQHLSEAAVGKLMVGPVVIIVKKAKIKKAKKAKAN